MNNCSVGIITSNQINAKRDRKALLGLSVRSVMVFETLHAAIERLNNIKNCIDLFLVDSAAKDYDGCDCIRQLRRDSRFRCLPAIMVTHESEYNVVLSAISAGCNGFVIRPYSVKTLEEHLKMAWDTAQEDDIEQEQLDNANRLIEDGKFDEAIEELREITVEMNEAEMYFEKGVSFLHKKLFGKAIIAFSRAVKINNMYAEAYGGLAKAYKGKGDQDAYTSYMKRAASIYAAQDRLDELKDMFIEILKEDPDAINPYNSMGLQMRREGNVKGAIQAYERALKLTPKDEHLHFNIANAYVFMERYKEAIPFLQKALILNPDFAKAQVLLHKLQGRHLDLDD